MLYLREFKLFCRIFLEYRRGVTGIYILEYGYAPVMAKRRHSKKEGADGHGHGIFRALLHKVIGPGSRVNLLTLKSTSRPSLTSSQLE